MNTESFFKKVLPREGFKVLAELVEIPGRAKPGWKYHKFESFAAAAEAALQLDAAGRVIYHACNSYGDWYLDAKKGQKRLRTQVNVKACRSLYDDVDVGKVGCYETRKEAGAALRAFLEASGMPSPMVVFSGAGLHLYWPLTEDIEPKVWARLASKKRLITKHFGLKVDAAVDVDSARVLRPIGTTWRKKGEAREVQLKVDAAPTDPVEMESIIDAILQRCNLSLFDMSPPDFLKKVDNSDLGGSQEFPPSYADIVAQHCAQMKIFKASGGESEPVWRAAIGVLVHCKDGDEKAHEWSASYPSYDRQETQSKLDNWSTGPSTCEHFRSVNPDGCMGCTHTCKSPIQLGMDAKEPPAPVPADTPVEAEAPAAATTWEHCWPDKFGYDKISEFIWTKIVDDDGVVQRVNVATPLFYPLHQVYLEDGTLAFKIRMHVRGGVTRDFDVPLKYLGDEKALRMQLAARQIHSFNGKMVQSFMNEYMINQRKRMEELQTYRQFGWHKEFQAFLIGSSLITESGVTTVTPGESIPQELRNAYETKGTSAEWANAVDKLYNVPNGEPYQFAIATMFGAVLNELLDYSEWKGVPLALTSDESGYGKTTISKIALNIYCRSEVTTVTDTTPKGIPARCSTMNNLPYLLDEMTKSLADPVSISDVLYTLSNGKSRVGLLTNGTERKAMPSWSCTPIITGNRNILYALTESKLNPEATQLRVFEVDINGYPRLDAMDEHHPNRAENQALAQHVISNCYGTVGTEWIRYIIKHRGDIQRRLRKVSAALPLMVRGNSTKERFYMHLLTCSLVGAQYARALGFINFDVTKMRDWAVAHLNRLRDVTRDTNFTSNDFFTAMLNDMHGRILVTNEFDGLDTRSKKVEESRGAVRGFGVVGRMVTGLDGKERPKLYLTVRAFDDWCRENGVQATKMKRDLIANGTLRTGTPGCCPKTGSVKVAIGRGVPGTALGTPRCFEFDYNAAKGSKVASTEAELKLVGTEGSSSVS